MLNYHCTRCNFGEFLAVSFLFFLSRENTFDVDFPIYWTLRFCILPLNLKLGQYFRVSRCLNPLKSAPRKKSYGKVFSSHLHFFYFLILFSFCVIFWGLQKRKSVVVVYKGLSI